jgi:mannose-6-phosphate isomerase-like protein (cupin superfamily)
MRGVSDMNNAPGMYQCPYYASTPAYNPNMYSSYSMYDCPYFSNALMYNPGFMYQLPDQYPQHNVMPGTYTPITLKDYGPEPFVIDIEEAAKQNNNFRTALWTGKHLQLTLMSINVGEDIGLEVHPNLDQFIRIEEGQGLVRMGDSKDRLDFQRRVYEGYVFIIPAGKWHNLINTGNRPLKLYSIYAPPQHPAGTVHKTKKDAAEKR